MNSSSSSFHRRGRALASVTAAAAGALVLAACQGLPVAGGGASPSWAIDPISPTATTTDAAPALEPSPATTDPGTATLAPGTTTTGTTPPDTATSTFTPGEVATGGPLVPNAGDGTVPKSADAFVSSIGVNTHLYSGVYLNFDDIILPTLRDSGIRHIRDQTGNVEDKMIRLAAEAGVSTTALISNFTGDEENEFAEVRDRLLNLERNGALVAVEGPNEPDLGFHNFSWQGQRFPEGVRNYQRELFETVNSTPELADTPVIAPAMGWGGNSPELGDISQWVDLCNTHDYPGHDNQGITGYIDSWSIMYARVNCGPDKPLVSTETGYDTGDTPGHDQSVSELAQGINDPRILTEHYNRGFQLTHLYQLMDENTDRSCFECSWGIVRSDGTPKPAMTAITNMISILEEPGAAFYTPRPVDITLVDAPQSIHQTLLQKSDGTCYLLLWQDVNVWSPEDTDISYPDVPVTVDLGGPAAVRTYDPLASADPTPVADDAGRISIDVGPEIVIVEIDPTD